MKTLVIRGYLVLFLGCLVTGCSHEQRVGDANSPEIAYRPQLRKAEEYGKEIYLRDTLAARATDILAEEVGSDLVAQGARGWITVRQDTEWVVKFIGEKDEQHVCLWSVCFAEDESTRVIKETTALTSQEEAMYRATRLGLSVVKQPCSADYNTVVLPDKTSGWIVYVLAAHMEPNVIVAGGHYRANISADGSQILESRAFTNTCLDIPMESDNPDLTGVAWSMLHVLDPTPTEIHVFLSLLHEIDGYVATSQSGFMWHIHEGQVKYAGDMRKRSGRERQS